MVCVGRDSFAHKLYHQYYSIVMKVLAVLFLGLAASSFAFSRSSRKIPGGGRIIGGQDAAEGQFPYQIVLLHAGSYICSGSILASNVVITAAHCVVGVPPRNLQIIAGELDRASVSGHEQTVQVVRIVVHESYGVPSDLANDIALLFLSDTVPLVLNEFVQPIALPIQEQQTSGEIIISGWGITTPSGSLSNILQWVELPVVDDATCQGNYPEEVILPSMLCAGFPQGGRDSCQGDDGGPLVSVNTGYLAGLISWGYGCALPGRPGVSTEVSYFVNWINDQMTS
ncbi:trypsin-1 [Folsomia candida]|uniref:trypsin-1 n=1 Tax=Folsomia candida TaxID=158441 RepID=UPI000B8FAF42|nr:trypsin-1 [Folsomia candida]